MILTRPFTGWHMFAILAAFFGVVVVVNVTMARLALSTFSGEVVENSYVASQRFNGWLAQEQAERALGWHVDASQTGAVETLLLNDASGRPIAGARIVGTATHPLGDPADQALHFRETQPGVYTAPLPAGRWQVRFTIAAQGHVLHKLSGGAGQ
jgi:nitrogen fixation protein FixH